MKQSMKILFFAILMAPLFLFTSCVENLQTSCDDFSLSIDVTTNDSTSVILTAIPEGGEPDFTYEWNTGDNTPSIEVVTFDTYSITVTDASACTVSLDFVVEADSMDISCDGFSSSITEDVGSNSSYLNAFVDNGTAPFTYLWSTNETAEYIEVDIPGDYTVVITDAEGCVTSSTFTYVQGGGLCDYDVFIDGSYDSLNNATILTVVIDSSAVGPFTYVWDNGSTEESIVVIYDGIYTVTVTDSNNCVFTIVYVVDTSPCNGFETNIVAVQDSSSNNVDLYSEVIGGTMPFTYQWSTGEISDFIIVEEGTGPFSVSVTDANGCLAEDQIQI